MATNFFSDFPTVAYTLDDYATQQVVVDIFRRVIFSKEYKDNSSYYEKYDVLDGETPEELSFRFYGTTGFHWLILMVNDIVDPRFEWPLSESNLVKNTESKYGGKQNIFATNRAKDKKGYTVETFFILAEEATHKEPIKLLFENNDPDGISTAVSYMDSEIIEDFESNYEVEFQKNENYRNILILKPEIVQDVMNRYKQILTT